MKLSEIFYFNKNDRAVGIWLVAIIACVIGIFAFGDNNDNEELAAATVQGQAPRSGYDGNSQSSSRGTIPPPRGGVGGGRRVGGGLLHSFDLNTASPDELIDLGFTEREIRSVMNYRSKGGIYRRVEQMAKISGMTKGEYDRLAPYFYVSDEFRPASDFVKTTTPSNSKTPSNSPTGGGQSHPGSFHPNGNPSPVGRSGGVGRSNGVYPPPVGEKEGVVKLKPGEKVPLNASDTTALKRIPGVGSYYASQIVRYREKLGGFFAIQQLDDLQNIPADIQDYLTLDPTPLRKIKVNVLSINRLIIHPYISFYQAKAIKEHIQKNGPLKSIRELSLNKNFTDADFNRLEPYMDYITP